MQIFIINLNDEDHFRRTIYSNLKNELINKIMVILAFVTIPATASSLARFYQIGWQPSYFIHIGVIPIIVLLAVYRKSISLYI